MVRSVHRRAGAIALAFAAALSLAVPAHAQQPLATGEMGWEEGYWATAEVLSANRAAGVLTISVRYVAGEDVPQLRKKAVFYKSYKEGAAKAYVVAGDKKYFPLSDTEGTPLIPESFALEFYLGRARGVWTGKFPAPPAEIKEVSLTLPLTSTLDGIWVTDR